MYLEIDEGFLGHRKTLKLCSLLKDPSAGVYLLRLWTWACRSCPRGDLRGMSGYDIEMIVQFRDMDGRCFQAMVDAGFIDAEEQLCLAASAGRPEDGPRPVAIHGWMERTGAAILKMEAEAERKRQLRANRKLGGKTGQNATQSSASSGLSAGHPQDSPLDRPQDGPRTKHHQDQSSPVQSSPVQSSPDPDLSRTSGARARVAESVPAIVDGVEVTGAEIAAAKPLWPPPDVEPTRENLPRRWLDRYSELFRAKYNRRYNVTSADLTKTVAAFKGNFSEASEAEHFGALDAYFADRSGKAPRGHSIAFFWGSGGPNTWGVEALPSDDGEPEDRPAAPPKRRGPPRAPSIEEVLARQKQQDAEDRAMRAREAAAREAARAQ